MLKTLQRLFESQTVGMKRSHLALVDVSIRQSAFDCSQSNECRAKCFEGLDVPGAGNLALGAKLFQVHFGTLRGWLIPNARSSGDGSGLGVGCCALGCAFAAPSNSTTGCIASVIFFAAVSAVSGFI